MNELLEEFEFTSFETHYKKNMNELLSKKFKKC